MKISEVKKADPTDYIRSVMQMISLAQTLCRQLPKGGVTSRLCQEVAQITGEKAQLHLHKLHQVTRTEQHPSFAITVPVRFRQKEYGVLSLAEDISDLQPPDLPLPVAALIANICGWILYTLEQSALVEGRCNQLHLPIHVRLTRREREVLFLIGCGYDNEKIAEALNITITTVVKHRQNIYEQLGVHCERDALFVAYLADIFSPLEEMCLY